MDMITEKQTIIRLLLSALIGAMIGVEREFNNRPAGLRTHVLVTLGSTLFMMISVDGHNYLPSGMKGDPYRIAAQVVSGIGFLGAGTIIKTGTGIRGLTTAASLWVSAGIGLAIGIGYYTGAMVAGVIVMVTLISSRLSETKIFNIRHNSLEVTGENRPGIVQDVSRYFESQSIIIRRMELAEVDEYEADKFCVRLDLKLPLNKKVVDVAHNLRDIKGVSSVRYKDIELE